MNVLSALFFYSYTVPVLTTLILPLFPRTH